MNLAFLIVSLFIPLFMNCSQGGGNQAKPSLPGPIPPSTVDPADQPDRETWVDFEILGKTPPLTKPCRTPGGPAQLVTSDPIVIDGNFEEWEDKGHTINDSPEDSSGSIDLHSLTLALREDSFYFGLELSGEIAEGKAIYLEFYRGYRQSVGQFQLEHILRISEETLEIYSDGEWVLLPSPFIVESKLARNRLEGKLSINHFLSGVVHSPVWGVQASVGGPSGIEDYTSLFFSPGIISNGYGQFRMDRCMPDGTSPLPLEYQEISTAHLGEVMGIIRFAEAQVGRQLGGLPFPVGSIGVFATDGGVAFDIPPKNKGAQTLGTTLDPLIMTITGNQEKFAISVMDGFDYDPQPEVNAYAQAVRRLFEIYAFGKGIAADPHLRLVVIESLASKTIKDSTNREFWIRYLFGKSRWSSRLGVLIGENFSSESILGAFQKSIEDSEKFWLELESRSPESFEFIEFAQKVYAESVVDPGDDLRQGSEEDPPVGKGTHPDLLELFSDRDRDGLPFFIEKKEGTNPSQFDSDGDAWSDFSEHIAGSDPTINLSHPGKIYPDGAFGDLVDFLPGKLFKDLDEGPVACIDVGDIDLVGLIYDKSNIFFGLQHAGKKSDSSRPAIRWAIDIEMPNQKFKARMEVLEGDKNYLLLNGDGNILLRYSSPFPLGIHALEIAVPLVDLGIKEVDESLKVKFSATETGEPSRFCDDTPWLVPLRRVGVP